MSTHEGAADIMVRGTLPLRSMITRAEEGMDFAIIVKRGVKLTITEQGR